MLIFFIDLIFWNLIFISNLGFYVIKKNIIQKVTGFFECRRILLKNKFFSIIIRIIKNTRVPMKRLAFIYEFWIIFYRFWIINIPENKML